MYMDELARYFRMQNGEEEPQDIPIDGDISDITDLGVEIEVVN